MKIIIIGYQKHLLNEKFQIEELGMGQATCSLKLFFKANYRKQSTRFGAHAKLIKKLKRSLFACNHR